MNEITQKIINELHSVVAQCTPMDAHTVLQEVIEEAQNLQDECLRMEYAFSGSFEDEEG